MSFRRVCFLALGFILVAFSSGLRADRAIPEGAGPLVVVGGAYVPALDEIMAEIVALKKPDKPLGIFNSGQPDSTARAGGEQFADYVNQLFGEDTAVYIHITESNNAGDDPEVVEQILACGGVFFLGGSQTSVMRSFFSDNGRGEARPAFDALWQIFSEGAVVGGSSAGAAIMSDPMISGGSSSNALLYGATAAGSSPGGVGYRKGMGFIPGILFCQHHLERGRFGRLLAGVVDPVFESNLGMGIAEDTGIVFDHSTRIARVIGDKGVLVIDPRSVERGQRGEMSGVVVHYLDRGDQINVDTLEITFAEGKEIWSPSRPNEEIQVAAWATDAIYDLIIRLGDTQGAEAGLAADTNFDIVFSKSPGTTVYRQPNETEGMRPTFSVTDLDVVVTRREEQASLYLHDWRFEDEQGTEFSAALNSARPWKAWSGDWADSVTTGDGIFRIQRDGSGLNRRVNVGETNDAELLYLLVRFDGWNLSNVVNDSSGQVAMRIHLMNGLAEDLPNQITAGFMLTLDDDGTFLMRADATGTAFPGGMSSEEISMFPDVLDQPLSFLVTYDTIRHEYSVEYKLGESDWEVFFSGTTSGVRSAQSLRFWIRGDFYGEGVNYLDIDRFSLMTFHPDDEDRDIGENVSIWDEFEVINDDNLKQTPFGLLWDKNWPWVYHYGLSSWLYCEVVGNYEDFGFYFYNTQSTNWYWVPAQTNQWVYRFGEAGSWLTHWIY